MKKILILAATLLCSLGASVAQAADIQAGPLFAVRVGAKVKEAVIVTPQNAGAGFFILTTKPFRTFPPEIADKPIRGGYAGYQVWRPNGFMPESSDAMSYVGKTGQVDAVLISSTVSSQSTWNSLPNSTPKYTFKRKGCDCAIEWARVRRQDGLDIILERIVFSDGVKSPLYGDRNGNKGFAFYANETFGKANFPELYKVTAPVL